MNRRGWSYLACAVSLALAAAQPVLAATPRSLLVGVYTTEDGAAKAYKELKDVQKTKAIAIDSFAVVSKNDKGQVSVHDTQVKDRRWGAVAGGIIGLLAMG